MVQRNKKIVIIGGIVTLLFFGMQTQLQATFTDQNDQDLVITGKHVASENLFKQTLDQGSGQNIPHPNYVPGEIIVKFKDTADVGTVVEDLHSNNQSFKSVTGDPNLDELNFRYKVKKIHKVFKNLGNGKGKHSGKITKTKAKNLNDDAKKAHFERVTALKEKFGRNIPSDPNRQVPYLGNTYKFEFSEEVDIEEASKLYSADPNVEYAQPNYYRMTSHLIIDDPFYSSAGSWGQNYDDLWGLKRINIDPAWDLTMGDGVIVAVVDTGLDYNHPDIRGNVWENIDEIPGNGIDDDLNGYIDDVRGWDFVNSDNDPMDGTGHGTHVAGTIAARYNGLGIIGVAPLAKIMPLKAFPDAGSGSIIDSAEAIIYAADNGADVINNSWGCSADPPELRCPWNPPGELAIKYAYGLGVVIVFSAGNSDADLKYFIEQNMPETLAVAASSPEDNRVGFSNYGEVLDVSAPGGGTRNILSLKSATTADKYIPYIVNNNYMRNMGTSMAAPHVSGLAALLIEQRPDFSVIDVFNAIRLSADDIGAVGKDIYTGYGRINASKALQTEPYILMRVTSAAIYDMKGNGDKRFNPGEIISVWVGIENLWLEADNVEATLISDDPFIQVVQPDFFLGTMFAGEKMVAKFEIFIDPATPYAHSLTLKIQLNALGGFTYIEEISDLGVVFVPANPPPPNQAGWPVVIPIEQTETINGQLMGAIVEDVNNDGQEEIIVIRNIPTPAGTDSTLYLYDKSGNLLPGWPQRFEGPQLPRPVIGDIDQDGDLEIFAGYEGFHHDGSSVVGWPKGPEGCNISGIFLRVTNIADVNNDGKNEVIGIRTSATVRTNGDPCWSGAQIYIWDGQGNPLPNMPIKMPIASSSSLGDFTDSISIPSIGDLDGDGDLEIVVTSHPDRSFTSELTSVYAWHHTGTPVVGWPVEAGGEDVVNHSPSLGDINGDGTDEVFVTTKILDSPRGGKLYIFDGAGVAIAGWPKDIRSDDFPMFPTSILGNMDDDDALEVMVFQNTGDNATNLYLFNANDATDVPGWPIQVMNHSAIGISGMIDYQVPEPIFVDITGDGRSDIIMPLAGLSLRIFAWERDGTEISGFPFDVPPTTVGWYSSLFAKDVDNDGDIEIGIVGFNNDEKTELHVNIWDLDQLFDAESNDWPMPGHDVQQTHRHVKLTSHCGDGFCSADYLEDGVTCPLDCSLTCGDGICTADEGFMLCEMDCPSPNCGDGFCSAADGEDTITCLPDCTLLNQVPSVNAGSNQTVTLPSVANLSGTVSDDGLPNPPGAVTTTWSMTSGPGTVSFGNAAYLDTTASFSMAGSYILHLEANDGELSSFANFTVTVNPLPPVPTVSLTANPSTIDLGQSSILTWSSTDTTSCITSGAWSSRISFSGSRSVSPTSTSTYIITCSGAGGSANDSVTVIVNSAPPPPSPLPTVSLTAKPNTIDSGQSSTLTWSSTDATSCTASGAWSSSKSTSGSLNLYLNL